MGDIKTLKKLECPYNVTTNGELSTLISFEVSVQELIDLVKLLLTLFCVQEPFERTLLLC